MPMPTVFGGDPIHYIEWRASFMSLIDRKGISSADKLYYLKKYVSGPAHNVLKAPFIVTMAKHTEARGLSSTNATGSHLSSKGPSETSCQNGQRFRPKMLKG